VAVVTAAVMTTAVVPMTRAAAAPAPPVHEWLTTGDQASRLARLPDIGFAPTSPSALQTVSVDDTARFQSIAGFGAALTDSSAWLLSRLPAATLDATLRSLFSPAAGGRLSVVRVPLGASDFVVGLPYTYDDQPAGRTDPGLTGFSIARDESYLVPLLRRIRALNPAVKFVASPWSAPAWMKTSGSLVGGTLAAAWEDVYAAYLVRVLKAFAADGVPVDALTVQNEPGWSPPDYPGMTLSEPQEAEFVGRHLGPALRNGRVTVSLLGYDHNWDPGYPAALLADREAAPYLTGVAFHCYAGDPSAQSTVHGSAPAGSAAIWLTECSSGSWSTDFGANLVWGTRNLVVGGTRNWASAVLWWNLALDPAGGPHTGGCAGCLGVLTVDPSTATVTRNVDYWSLAQATVALRPGAVRVGSTTFGGGDLETTAFRNPDGTHGLVIVNSGGSARPVRIQWGSQSASTTVPGGAVATFAW